MASLANEMRAPYDPGEAAWLGRDVLTAAGAAAAIPRIEEDSTGVYMCLCKGLTEQDVRRVARAGATTAATLIEQLGLDDECCCGRCLLDIEPFVALARREAAGGAPIAPPVVQPRRLAPVGV